MMKMLLFGDLWDRPMRHEFGIVAAPALCCFHCGEWIERSDSGVIQSLIDDGVACIAYHHECHARLLLGSLGHQQKRCSCYGGDEEDPPGMSLREAAKAALTQSRLDAQK